MGHIPIPRCQRLPRFLPGVHLLPEPVQFHGFRDQLYLVAGFRVVCGRLQVLEQNTVGSAGRDGYLDWKEGDRRCDGGGTRRQASAVVVGTLFCCCRLGRMYI